MTHSTLWLAQIQFFSGFGFMLLFLVLEFGLAWVLLYFRIRATHTPPTSGWVAAYRFWVRVFALTFILSFAAGLPVLIQFGSLWPHLMGKIGDIAGPLVAATILSIFIFKSCFLGAMLFGVRRLSNTAHTLMVVMVAIGVTLSSFFMLALISWTHTPTGATLINGQYVVNDVMQVLFNPALPWYGALFVAMSLLTVAFLMMAVVSGQAARNPAGEAYRPVFKTALCVAVAGIVLYGFSLGGTLHLAVEHQPAKAAAVAGYWHSGAAPELVVSGWPDAVTSSNRFAWVWPGQVSALLGSDGSDRSDGAGGWRGLDQFSGMTPPVALTFWAFRIAALIGVLLLLTTALLIARLHRHRYDPGVLSEPWCGALKLMAAASGLMVLASMAYVQFGAFPYAVYETITLSEIMSSIPILTLMGTSVLYGVCQLTLFVGFLYLLRYISRYGVIPVARRRGRA